MMVIRVLVLLVGRCGVPYLEHVVQDAYDPNGDVHVRSGWNRWVEELPVVLAVADGEEKGVAL